MGTHTKQTRVRELNSRQTLSRVHRAAHFIKKSSVKVRNFDSVKAIRELRESR